MDFQAMACLVSRLVSTQIAAFVCPSARQPLSQYFSFNPKKNLRDCNTNLIKGLPVWTMSRKLVKNNSAQKLKLLTLTKSYLGHQGEIL